MTPEIREDALTGAEIAIIGMDSRFPGANNIEEFWDNLEKGIESISFFSEDELAEVGLDESTPGNPQYIAARGILEGIDYFDASFFNLIPGEVKSMDPQMRIFHECTWKALEDAGYDPGTYHGLIGLYTGAASGFIWEAHCLLSGIGEEVDPFTASHFRRKDHLATRVSYKLNLKGPSFTMATACSSSLVAINQACQGILSGECDMALAGGVNVLLPQKRGYIYRENMIFSSDGHNRAFDAAASGTVFGNGIGLVVLKLLEQAREDGDNIYAVIKGFATNNDGSRKTGYTAPSVDGQAEVIQAALHMAEIPAESVSYLETHGTATELGDPVEIEALKVAFATDKKQFCAIGSVKTNVGHLDVAAGVAGLIKTVLAIKHRLIPPSLFYKIPNPKIDFENSPFYVNRELSPWKTQTGVPRRAGVSSFGIGGTNAHVVLEEWPIAQSAERRAHSEECMGHGAWSQGRGGVSPPEKLKDYQLILLSAKTAEALQTMTVNFLEHLKKNPGINLRDAAYTLQVGRAAFTHRKMMVCSTSEEAAAALSSPNSDILRLYTAKEGRKPVIFMFPGQGAQYINMGQELYEKIPYFRQEMNRCFEILNGLLDYDIKAVLYPGEMDNRSSRSNKSYKSHKSYINQTEITQPVLFIFEYALAKLLMHWGIKPYAMIGHSVGEYVAACLSGVFSPEDALSLVFHRGRLMQQMPAGAMLAVSLPENQLIPLLGDEPDLAAVNGPSSCVLAGSCDAIELFKKKLEEKKIEYRTLHTSHAFHSKMMEPVITKFQEYVEKIKLNKPEIPFISNLTGQWITVEQAVSPQYWAMQLRNTVKFSPGIEEILEKESNPIWLEIGPGNVLSTLVRQHRDNNTDEKNPTLSKIVNLVRHPKENFSDFYYLLTKLGQLWLYGAVIDWVSFYSLDKKKAEKNYRIPLPTYPFEKQVHPIPVNPFRAGIEKISAGSGKHPNISNWFYIPSWKRSKLAQFEPDVKVVQYNWLVFVRDEHCALGVELVKRLKKDYHHVVTVGIGTAFTRSREFQYFINPGNNEDYHRLFRDLHTRDLFPHKIIHLWNTAVDKGTGLTGEEVDALLCTGFYSLLYISQALMGQVFLHSLPIDIVTHQLHDVVGGEQLSPARATVLGPLKVIMQENPNILCRCIDIEPPGWKNPDIENLIRHLLTELTVNLPDPNTGTNTGTVIAYRNNRRWVQTFEPFRLNKQEKGLPRVREKGVYLITGGLGKIGLLMAEHLVKCARAKLVLVSRNALPVKEQWQQWLSTHGQDEPISRKILKVCELEKQGGEVRVLSADTADIQQMQEVIALAEKCFGPINGVIHAAGVFAQRPSSLISEINETRCKEQFQPKIYGAIILEKVLSGQNLDFCLLMSSISSVLGGLGLIAYSAANNFLDTFAAQMNRQSQFPWISVNWDAWNFSEKKAELAMTPHEGLEVFKRILSWKDADQVIVSSRDLQVRINQWVKGESLQKAGEDTSPGEIKVPTVSRPDGLPGPYVSPATPTEKELTAVWEKFFGIKPIGIRDDFFELGGDSLKAVTLIAEIHKTLNVKISLMEFFNRQTIEKAAAFIENNLDKDIYASIEPVEEKGCYPLSPSQQRLFFLHQMDPQSTVYNICQILPLKFEFDKGKLEWILKKLVERHESLRTSFQIKGGELSQRIHEYVDFEIEYFDMNMSQDFIRPFDLSLAPLLRVGLTELPHTPAHPGHKEKKQQYILMIDMHHIISDGVSLDIFLKDFFVLYRGEELPGLRIQYKDYSEWKNRQAGEELTAKQEKYWIKTYDGEIPLLELPTDYVRPAVQDYEGKTIRFEIGPEQTEALKKLVLKEEVTLFMLIISIYYVLLLKLSSQEDIVVATPVAGRKHPDLHYIIGNFLNTLVLRNYPTGEQFFTSFLKKVKQRTLEAFENQDYPFENLVNQVQVNRDLSRNPLFDTMFIFHNERDLQKIPGEKSSHLKPGVPGIEKRTAQFDLTLVGFERGNHLYFRFEYCTKLFKEESIQRFINYFNEIVFSVLENPNRKLSGINILSQAERDRLLVEFNNTKIDYAADKALNELFQQQVERTPDHVALVGVHETHEKHEKKYNMSHMSYMSYKELSEKSHQLAFKLKEKGVKPGTIVAIMVNRTVRMMVGFLGILKAGGTYLPLDPEYPGKRINYILGNSNTEVLVTTPQLQAKIKSEAAEGGVHSQWKSIKIINIEKDYFNFPGSISSTLTSTSTCRVSPANPAYVIYTSGSTGNPKGVMVQHKNTVNFIKGMTSVIDFLPGKSILALTTISFDIFFLETLLPVTLGMKVIIADEAQQKDPQLLEKIILHQQVNILQLTPSRLQLLLSFKDNLHYLSSVEELIVGGEAFPTHLFEQIKEKFAGKIYNVYGPTETTIWSTIKDLTRCDTGELTIGSPIANTQVYIIDRHSRIQPLGVGGELLIGGDGVATGYLNNVELTAEKFDHDLWDCLDYHDEAAPFGHIINAFGAMKQAPGKKGYRSYKSYTSYVLYKTGDWARWLPKGEIEFLGRVDHQVKIRGFRIELEEIEEQLLGHQDIKEAVVTAKTVKKGDNYLAAYIVPVFPGKEKEFDVDQLRDYLARQLPHYMIPSYFIFLENIPLTPNGKINRLALPDPGQSRPQLSINYAAPESDQEKTVAQLWRGVLNVDKIGIYDNFFDLGGNSLKLIQLNEKLKEALGKEIPVITIFRYPTIESLLQYLGQGNTVSSMTDKQIDETVGELEETMGLLVGMDGD